MKRVFILENDHYTAEIMQYILSDAYEVRTMCMPVTELESLKEFCPDLLIIDHWAGVMDNFEFYGQIRVLMKHAQVILSSTQSNGAEVAKRLAAASCLPKPFDLDELLVTVKNAIGI